MRVTDLIAQDHRQVHALFIELELADERARQGLLDRLIDELEVHADAEEVVVYPALRRVSRRIDDAEAAHVHMRALLTAVADLEPTAADFAARLRHLKGAVLNHVAEEEGGVLMDAARLGLEALERLGAEMEERKHELRRESAPLEGERPTRAA